MKSYPSSGRNRAYAWKSFDRRYGRHIEAELCGDGHPCCPYCGLCLEARPSTRCRGVLVLDATGFDLDCRACRRFWSVVRHTPRSLRLLRMRRFMAAVRAAAHLPQVADERTTPYAGYSVAVA
jgi:hypothetical protein